ncbi:MAG: hypothetical protein ABIA21_03095 [Candidatus Aenigmatarchaeota archaeon]
MVGIEPLVASLSGAVGQTVAYLPWLVITIVILVIGLVIGKIVGRLIKEVLTKLKVDYYVTEEKKPAISLSVIIATISRWVIYIGAIRAAFGLTFQDGTAVYGPVSDWVIMGFNFIPAIIGAAVVLLVGYVLGEYIKNQFAKTGKPYSVLTGKIVLFFTLYVSIAIALPLLFAPMAGIQPLIYAQYMGLIGQILLVIIIAVAAAFALAVGLGGREAVGAMMKKWAKKNKYA